MFSTKHGYKIKRQWKLLLLALVAGALEMGEWSSLSLLLGCHKAHLRAAFFSSLDFTY